MKLLQTFATFWKFNLLMITTCKLYFLIESFEKCTRSAAEGCCWRKMEKDERRRRWWFFVGKTQIEGKLLGWEESSSSKAQKILYIFAVNATLSNKKEGDLNYFNFKSWKLSFHLQKEVLFSQLDLFSFFPNHICWRSIYLLKWKEKVSFEIVTIMCNTICQWYIIMHYSSRRSSFFVIYYEFDGVLDNLKFMHFLSSTTAHNLNWVEYENKLVINHQTFNLTFKTCCVNPNMSGLELILNISWTYRC